MFAKRFFYVCAGLLCIVLSYHLGATNAKAQTQGNPIIAAFKYTAEYDIAEVVANGDIHVRHANTGAWIRLAGPFSEPTSVQDLPSQRPPVAKSHPNPFRERTSFDLSLSSPGRVEVEVFDVSGRVVRKLDAGQLGAGSQRVEWDGTDQTNRQLPTGTYFYTVSVNGVAVSSQKAVLLR